MFEDHGRHVAGDLDGVGDALLDCFRAHFHLFEIEWWSTEEK